MAAAQTFEMTENAFWTRSEFEALVTGRLGTGATVLEYSGMMTMQVTLGTARWEPSDDAETTTTLCRALVTRD